MKASLLKIVNPILAVLFLNQVLTGILHDWLPHEAYEVLHEGGGMVFATVAFLHVLLNWSWVKATFFRKPPTAKS